MKTEPKWTPGPWRNGDPKNLMSPGHVMAKRDGWSSGYLVAACCGASDSSDRGLRFEQIANADLIAAAPDLYAALDAMLRCEAEGGDLEDLRRVNAAAEAALAKARGEQP
jgi:hypothetical protein